jgi:4-amino-4-deoxy-L-arabinose transferase-like glycosyltransferase
MAADSAYRPVYVTDLRVQLPGLGLAPFAAALQLFGVHLWTMRLVTGIAGALTVLPVYALVSRLGGRRDVALLAALLVAISSWQIAISRFSFPTIFEPLLTWGGLWLFDRALRPKDGRASRPLRIGLTSLLAGVCFGLAAQTYHIGRFAPLMGGLLALAILNERRQWKGWLLGVIPAVLGCLLVLAPLIVYALRQPDDFNGRVSAVFVLSEEARQGRAPLAALDDSLRRHLLMFNVAGDLNGRHHAPGRPMLDYVTGLGFLLGVAALLRRIAGWRSLFLLAALGVGLLPSALSVDAPHGMRAFEAAPLSCAIAAIGLAELLRMIWPDAARPRRIVAWGASVALALALALNAWVYFAIMPPNPEVFLGFYPVQSQMGVYVRDAAGAPGGGRIYVPRTVVADEVFAFLSAGLPVETFEGAMLSAPPQPGDRFLISGYFAEQEVAALAPFLGANPQPLAAGPGFPDGRGPTFFVYQIPVAP